MDIGIIGGADGPTAVLVSSNIPLWIYGAGLIFVAAIVVAAIAIIKK